jgi:hypothetical protein
VSVLKYFITSKAKRNLLTFLFTSGDTEHYTREIARLTGEGNQKHYGVLASFPYLEELRLFVLEADAAQASAGTEEPAEPAHVSPSQATPVTAADIEPIIPGAHVIMSRKDEAASADLPATQPGKGTVATFADRLKNEFRDINSITLAIIHGESATAQETPPGGIDLLIVGDINKDALLELTANIEDDTGVHINMTRMARSDFDYRTAKGDPLIRRIWGEKKLVVKGKHQL